MCWSRRTGHTPAVEGFFDKVAPLSPRLNEILETATAQRDDATMRKGLGIQQRYANENFHDAMVRLVTQPTINIQGLVAATPARAARRFCRRARRRRSTCASCRT